MGATLSWTGAPTAHAAGGPNEVLRRIDVATTEIHHWVRYGMVGGILLLALLVHGF